MKTQISIEIENILNNNNKETDKKQTTNLQTSNKFFKSNKQ